MAKNNKVIVITGPTASGKSAVAVCLAKKIDGEIISADSMQIYKGLDIGTAKITKKEMLNVPHYMLDICNIDENYSVAEYKTRCYEYIEEILARRKTPIIVGGTGLYINAVVNNMQFDKEENIDITKYDNYAQEELIDILKKLDKEALDSIDINNKKRVIRAITMAESGNLKSSKEKQNDLWNANPSKYDFFVTYIDIPRDLLYDKIEKRIDAMDEKLLTLEAKKVWDIKNEESGPVQAIGYKEIFPYIEGKTTFEDCMQVLKQNTRHYAKRQITWFKKLKKDLLLDGTKMHEKLVEEIVNKYNGR